MWMPVSIPSSHWDTRYATTVLYVAFVGTECVMSGDALNGEGGPGAPRDGRLRA